MFSGADYLPFAEIPSLRNMVLTGEDDGDMSYMKMHEAIAELPDNKPRDNSSVVPYRAGPPGASNAGGPAGRGGNAGGRGGFRAVYD